MLNTKNRFHRRKYVNNVYKKGRRIRGQDISLTYNNNESINDFRVAVVVSKKVSKSAVVRNRIRRRIFEIVRLESKNIPTGFEMVITVFSNSVADKPHNELKKQVLDLLAKAIW
jgi:ribonuclease P protein component